MKNAPPSPFEAFRSLLEEPGRAMRKAKELHPRIAPAEAPVPGTLAHLNASLEWARTLPDVRDLRSQARTMVDNAWQGAVAECRRRFCVVPSVEPTEQRDPGAASALTRVRDAETRFITLSGATHSSGDDTKHAFDSFCSALAAWLGASTAGWKTAEQRARQARKDQVWR